MARYIKRGNERRRRARKESQRRLNEGTGEKIPQSSEKDPYFILGVAPEAALDDIHHAYRERARFIHPDRFDPQRYPKDWHRANEVFSELNNAYSLIKDVRSRHEVDTHRASAGPQHPQTPPQTKSEPSDSTPFPFELGHFTSGHAKYADLPEHIQSRLLKRQERPEKEHFQVRLASIAWNHLFVSALLGWFWVLFAAANGPQWGGIALLCYSGFTLTVGLFVGRNLVKITKWMRSTIRPYFYVTPMYFIKTEYDSIQFRPIWTLKDIAVTHNYKDNSYQNSNVILKFSDHNESLSLSPKEQVEAMLAHMKTYESRLRTEFTNDNHAYSR